MALHIPPRFPILSLAAALVGFTTPAAAAVVEVAIDTSSLAGTAAQLAFDLIDGDTLVNNSVTITAFNTDGALGAAATSGGVTGTLPGTVVLTDTNFFNELLQPITFAIPTGFIRFTLTPTGNSPSGSIPDQVALFLLDSSASNPLPLFDTSDPTGANALFTLDLSLTDGLSLYYPTSSPAVTWTVTNVAIPEPSAVLLFATGLLGLGLRRRR